MFEKRKPSYPRSCHPLTRAENIAICCAPSFHKPRTRDHRRAGEEGVEKAEAGIASIDRSGGHAGGSWQRWIRRLYFRVAHGRPMTLVELAGSFSYRPLGSRASETLAGRHSRDVLSHANLVLQRLDDKHLDRITTLPPLFF